MNGEQRKTMSVPAYFANRFYVSRYNGITRVSFGEQLDGEVSYSTAVMTPDDTMIALRDMLNQFFPEKPNDPSL